MIEKLETIMEKYRELTAKVVDPNIIADNRLWQKLVKEHSDLTPIAEGYEKLKKCLSDLASAEEMLKTEKDPEMVALSEEEIKSCKKNKEALEEELKVLLLPKDENDDKNVIVEIRAGAGGDEAALFASELMRMYMMYAEKHHFKSETLSLNDIELGGIKEVVFQISGNGAYSKLKFESGVHRVQRVPETESQGRVHTSTVTVAVLPELEEVEFEILDKDLRVDTYRSSGAGGQHVNKTDSAIRMTHLPTGIVVTCQDERSQLKNREKAMMILKAKLYDFYQGQKNKEYADSRKAQVGTGDRSERIRTYNFPQGRITDHRIGFTAYNLLDFMNGDIDELISELQLDDQKRKLESLDNQN
ncbi:MAG: peptide chain release factor 1 [Clostridia bacterium]|nr:peptide chain release factor 1 [Clostridia bacterium]